jgi:endonuclease YncB( thermonuclease family)
MNKRQTKITITVFLFGLIGVCLLLTFGLSPYLREAASRSDAFDMLGKVQAVESGAVLAIQQRGSNRVIRLLGVESPALPTDPALMAQASRRGVDPDWLGEQGRVTRNTLAAWIYRRGLKVEYPRGEEAVDEAGRHWVYAEVAGIDLARKLLQGGQVYAADIEHPRAAMYRELEQQARDRQIGLWARQAQ